MQIVRDAVGTGEHDQHRRQEEGEPRVDQFGGVASEKIVKDQRIVYPGPDHPLESRRLPEGCGNDAGTVRRLQPETARQFPLDSRQHGDRGIDGQKRRRAEEHDDGDRTATTHRREQFAGRRLKDSGECTHDVTEDWRD